MKLGFKLITIVGAVALASGCKTPSGDSTVKDAVDGTSLPMSIHNKPLPLGQQVGVVVEISSGFFGVSSSVKAAATNFTDLLKPINSSLKTNGHKLMFVAVSIDAGSLGGLAAGQIAAQDTDACHQAETSLALDEATVQSQVVLFFNDSGDALKNVFGTAGGNPTVAVIDATGTITGNFNLPDDANAAIAAVNAALAAQQAAAPATPAAPAGGAPAPAS
jgi:hypothetical protein